MTKIIRQDATIENGQVVVTYTTDDGQTHIKPYDEFKELERELNTWSGASLQNPTDYGNRLPTTFAPTTPNLTPYIQPSPQTPTPNQPLISAEEFEERRWDTPAPKQEPITPSSFIENNPYAQQFLDSKLGQGGTDLVQTFAPELTGGLSKKGRYAIPFGSQKELPGPDASLSEIASAINHNRRQSIATLGRTFFNPIANFAQEVSDTFLWDLPGWVGLGEGTTREKPNRGFLRVLPPLPYLRHENGNNEWEEIGTGLVQFGLGLFTLAKGASLAARGAIKLTPTGVTALSKYDKLPNIAKGFISAPAKSAVVDWAGIDQYEGRFTDLANSIVKGVAADEINFEFLGESSEAFDAAAEGFVNSFDGDIANIPFLGYLVSDESDEGMSGRFKNVVEGIYLGALVDPLIAGVRTVKLNRGLYKSISKFNAKATELDIKLGLSQRNTEYANRINAGDPSESLKQDFAQNAARRYSIYTGTAPEMQPFRKDVEVALNKVRDNSIWRDKTFKRLEAIGFEEAKVRSEVKADPVTVRDDQVTVAQEDSKNPISPEPTPTSRTDERKTTLQNLYDRTTTLLTEATKTAKAAERLKTTSATTIKSLRRGIAGLESLKSQAQLDELDRLSKIRELSEAEITQRKVATKTIDRGITTLSDNQLLGLMELDAATIGELRYDQERLQGVIDSLEGNVSNQQAGIDLALKTAKLEEDRLASLRDRQLADLNRLEEIGKDSKVIKKFTNDVEKPDGLRDRVSKKQAELDQLNDTIARELLDFQRKQERGLKGKSGARSQEVFAKRAAKLNSKKTGLTQELQERTDLLNSKLEEIKGLENARDEKVNSYFKDQPTIESLDPEPPSPKAKEIDDPLDSQDSVKTESNNQTDATVTKTVEESNGSQPARAVTLESRKVVVGVPALPGSSYAGVPVGEPTTPVRGSIPTPSSTGRSLPGSNQQTLSLPGTSYSGIPVGDVTSPVRETTPGTLLPGDQTETLALPGSSYAGVPVGQSRNPNVPFSFVGQNRLALPQAGQSSLGREPISITTETPSGSTAGNLVEVRASSDVGQQLLNQSNVRFENGQLVITGAPIDSSPYTKNGQRFWRAFYSMPEQQMMAAIDNAPEHLQRRMFGILRLKLARERLNDMLSVVGEIQAASEFIDSGAEGYEAMRDLVLNAWRRDRWAKAHTSAAGRFLIGRTLGLGGRFIAAEGISEVAKQGLIDLISFAPGLVSPVFKGTGIPGLVQLGNVLDGLSGAEHWVSHFHMFGLGGDIANIPSKLAIDAILSRGFDDIGTLPGIGRALENVDRFIDSIGGDWLKTNTEFLTNWLSKRSELRAIDDKIARIKGERKTLETDMTVMSGKLLELDRAGKTDDAAKLRESYSSLEKTAAAKDKEIADLENQYKESFSRLSDDAIWSADIAGKIHAPLVNATGYAIYGAETAILRALRLVMSPLEYAYGTLEIALSGGLDRQIGANIQGDTLFLNGQKLVSDTVTQSSEAVARTVEQVIDPSIKYESPTIPNIVGADFEVITPGDVISEKIDALNTNVTLLWNAADDEITTKLLQGWTDSSSDLQFEIRGVLESQEEIIALDSTGKTGGESADNPVKGFFKRIQDEINQAPVDVETPTYETLADTTPDLTAFYPQAGWERQQKALDAFSGLYKQISRSPKAALALLSELITRGDQSANRLSLPNETYTQANNLPVVVRNQAEQLLNIAKGLPFNMDGVRKLLGPQATKADKKQYVGFIRALKLAATRQIEWADAMQALIGLKAESDLKIGYGKNESITPTDPEDALIQQQTDDLTTSYKWLDVESIEVPLTTAEQLQYFTQTISENVKARWTRAKNWVKQTTDSAFNKYETIKSNWEDSFDSPQWERDRQAKEALGDTVVAAINTAESQLSRQDTEISNFQRRFWDTLDVTVGVDRDVQLEKLARKILMMDEPTEAALKAQDQMWIDTFKQAYDSAIAIDIEMKLTGYPPYVQKLARANYARVVATGKIASAAGTSLAQHIRTKSQDILTKEISPERSQKILEQGRPVNEWYSIEANEEFPTKLESISEQGRPVDEQYTIEDNTEFPSRIENITSQGISIDAEEYIIDAGEENATRAENYVSNRATVAVLNKGKEIVSSAKRLGNNLRNFGKAVEDKLPWQKKQTLAQQTQTLDATNRLNQALEEGNIQEAADASDDLIESIDTDKTMERTEAKDTEPKIINNDAMDIENEGSSIDVNSLKGSVNEINGEQNRILSGNSDARSQETGELATNDDGGRIVNSVQAAPVADADAAVLTASAVDESPEIIPERATAGSVADFPINEITVDPAQFQTPGGTVRDSYRPQMAKELQVYYDPQTGNTILINGHHRLEAAKQSNAESVNVYYVSNDIVSNGAEASILSDIQNTFDRGGNSVDAARVLRNPDVTPGMKYYTEDAYGRKGQNAVKLSRLSDPLFNLLNNNEMNMNQALALGDKPNSPSSLNRIWEMAKEKNWSANRIKQAVWETDNLDDPNLEKILTIRNSMERDRTLKNWKIAASSPQVKAVMNEMIPKMENELLLPKVMKDEYKTKLEAAANEYLENDLGIAEGGTPVSEGVFDSVAQIRSVTNKASNTLENILGKQESAIPPNKISKVVEDPWEDVADSSQSEPRNTC